MFRPDANLLRFGIKPLVFVLSLSPFVWLLWAAFNDALGTNPVEAMTHQTGEWTLRFLLITLLVTPLRQWLHAPWLIQLRRMLGLYAFFYASLHLLTYLWFDQDFDWQEILVDIPKRPFVTIGFAAFLLLVPLAATSNRAMQRRLKNNWKRLHRLAYVAPALGVIHFFWLVKADLREPLIYAGLLACLLGYRFIKRLGVTGNSSTDKRG